MIFYDRITHRKGVGFQVDLGRVEKLNSEEGLRTRVELETGVGASIKSGYPLLAADGVAD